MTIHTINACSIAIYIDSDDPSLCHGEELDLERARPIVSTALIEAGMRADRPMEIEAFQRGDNVLIFARVLDSSPLFYFFSDVEPLLEAVSALQYTTADSALFYTDGGYCLAVGSEDERAGEVLREFCEPRELPGGYLLHLKEHGRVICNSDAVSTLTEYFD